MMHIDQVSTIQYPPYPSRKALAKPAKHDGSVVLENDIEAVDGVSFLYCEFSSLRCICLSVLDIKTISSFCWIKSVLLSINFCN